MPSPIPVAILGPTGYTGLELIELLSRHPLLKLAYLASARTPAPRIDHEFPRLAGRIDPRAAECRPIDHDAIAESARLAFLCLPHDAAMEHAPPLLSRGMKVVDLSAAYRIKHVPTYERAYGHPHTDPENLAHAVYGLTEFAREQVRTADLVANPGCYPTAAALALVPLLRAGLITREGGGGIIINAASGVSGAGRHPKPNLHFPEANENFSAYGIGTHRHQPEIAQSLDTWGGGSSGGGGGGGRVSGSSVSEPLFVPHLLPIDRGILETIYATPTSDAITTADAMAALSAAYKGEPFIAVRADPPALRDVQRTNMVHLSARVVHGRVIITAAEDNLTKGASGQAIQNANLMLGLEETAGLT